MVGPPCSPRDSQESNPTLQFKSINSLGLSFLFTPTLTSIYDYWKNHSFDKMVLVWQINGETVETVADFIFGTLKLLQMVIAAMKLKDAYFLEGKV